MKKNEIMTKITRSLGKAKFGLKKHSPEILVAAGIVGAVVSAVMACKATTKLDDILSDTREKMDVVHKGMETGEINGEEYTVEDGKKDTTIFYAKAAWNIGKLYAPSVALGALSITSILAGHNILRKRNVALAAAYTAVESSFKMYRDNIIDRFGKEVDDQIRHGVKGTTEVESTTTDEDGNEVTEKKNIDVVDPEAMSEYAKIFDRNSNAWDKDRSMNEYFLHAQESYLNDLLKAQGYLFLNDVYDALGIPKTKAGQIVGWIYDEKNPIGDNCVDLGRKEVIINGTEKGESAWIIDPNVDGNILNNF